MSDILILIPAAGASRRMEGRDKLLEEIDGEPILTRQTRRALATGADVLVTIAEDRPGRWTALDGVAAPALTRVSIDGSEGMSVSLRTAGQHAWAGGYLGLMIVLPDMPDLEAADLERVMTAFRLAPDLVHRGASAEGQAGHPVVLPRSLFAALDGLGGDHGARHVLREKKQRLVPLAGNRALTDLDTPQEWAAWRDGTGQRTGNRGD